MTFKLLNSLDISDGTQIRRISLYEGELTTIPSEHRADILIVSSFPDDYIPTSTSLIGALERSGLSVGMLAKSKAYDLRGTCSFWLSHPISGAASKLNVGQVACFEPLVRGEPPALVGDLFRGLFPFLDTSKDQTVAMPLLATGDQGWQKAAMLKAILEAAAHWLARGLPIRELKIVERNPDHASKLVSFMDEFKKTITQVNLAPRSSTPYDVFLSFSSHDGEAAVKAGDELKRGRDAVNVFDFRLSIDKGSSWQTEIDSAISSSKIVIAILSPQYFKSPECQEELQQARLRNKRSPQPILFPIYWSDIGQELALWIQTINYADCREQNYSNLATAISRLPLK